MQITYENQYIKVKLLLLKSALWSIIMVHARTIMIESDNIDLAHLKKKEESKVGCLVFFWLVLSQCFFIPLGRSLVGHETLQDECYIVEVCRFEILKCVFFFGIVLCCVHGRIQLLSAYFQTGTFLCVIAYSTYTCYTCQNHWCVKIVCVSELQRWHQQKHPTLNSKLPWMAYHLTNRWGRATLQRLSKMVINLSLLACRLKE